MDSFTLVEKNAEKVTGLSVAKLREYSPNRFRKHLESKKGKVSFRQSDIAAIRQRYHLTAEEVDLIFFAKELS